MLALMPASMNAQDTLWFRMDTIAVAGTRAKQFAAEKSVWSIDSLRHVAIFQDPIRAATISSDAVRSGDVNALPFIAGDEPERVLSLLNGFPISLPYRFLGAFSIFNPLLLRSLDIASHGYGVEQGGYFSPAIRAESPYTSDHRFGAFADVSLPVSIVVAAIPLHDGSDTYARISARRSHLGAVSALVSDDLRKDMDAFTPDLADVQYSIHSLPSAQWQLFQQGLYSDEKGTVKHYNDDFSYRWKKAFLAARASYAAGTVVSTAGISWEQDRVAFETSIAAGTLGSQPFSLDGQFDLLRGDIHSEWQISEAVQLLAGTEWTLKTSACRFVSTLPWLRTQAPVNSAPVDAAAYSSVSYAPLPVLEIRAGFRAATAALVGESSLEPRADLRFRPDDATDMTFSAGSYVQPPTDFQMLYGFLSLISSPQQPPRILLISSNTRALHVERSNIAAVSASRTMDIGSAATLTATVDGYFKREPALIMSSRYPEVFTPLDSASTLPAQHFSAEKRGAGLDLSFSFPTLHAALRAIASLQKSVITDSRDGSTYPGSADIPFSAKILGSWTFAGTLCSILFQYYDGAPATEQYYLPASTIFGDRFYIPLWKKLNSGRLPAYGRCDIHVEHPLTVAGVAFVPYLDLINVFNRKNITQFQYSFSPAPPDYADRRPVDTNFPFFPWLGIKAEYHW